VPRGARQERNVWIGNNNIAGLGDQFASRLAEPGRSCKLTIDIICIARRAGDVLAPPRDEMALAFQISDVQSTEPACQYFAAEASASYALWGHAINVLTNHLAP